MYGKEGDGMTRKGNLRQSDRDAIARYDAKTYKIMTIKLRKDTDAEIIGSLELARRQGMSYHRWLEDLFVRADGGVFGRPPHIEKKDANGNWYNEYYKSPD